jgi:hypothetical protein
MFVSPAAARALWNSSRVRAPAWVIRSSGGGFAAALLIAGGFAFPVNRWLLARGKGHAIAHDYHHAD